MRRPAFLWKLYRNPALLERYQSWDASKGLVLGMAVAGLVGKDQFRAAQWAVRKVGLDAELKEASAEQKRREALEWMHSWCRENEIVLSTWKARFLLELALGIEKGYLPVKE